MTSFLLLLISSFEYSFYTFLTGLKAVIQIPFFTSPTSPLEVSEILCYLNSRNAIGPSSMPDSIISIVLDHLSNILSNIINLSFSTGVFPDNVKETNVIPIFKN